MADIIWVGYAGWYEVIEKIVGKVIIFDKMDEDSEITHNLLLKKLLCKVEPRLVKKADFIFTTAHIFYNQLSKQKDHVFLLHEYCIRDGITIVDYPNWVYTAEYLRENYEFKIVCDYMDDFTGFLNPAKEGNWLLWRSGPMV